MEKNNEQTLADLKAKIAVLEADNAAKEATINKFQERDEGWLIFTPNVLYNGVTGGVRFTNGCAFIPKNMVLERYVSEPPAPNVLATYSEEQQAQILENCKLSSAERCVLTLTSDFGYKAEYFSKDDGAKLDEARAKRALERKEFEAQHGTREEMFERLLAAHRF